MSAGTGVMHSEYNKNKDESVKFLQIWVFPKEENVEPRYDQKSIKEGEKINGFQQILSPNKNDDGVWIHQDAWFNIANFTQGNGKNYTLNKKGNGVYAFVLKGSAKVGDRVLNERDGLGIWDTQSFNIEAVEDTEILLMEVPMELPSYLR
jgi:redox-sensitive bicupin YhaK (pirin superfamily)